MLTIGSYWVAFVFSLGRLERARFFKTVPFSAGDGAVPILVDSYELID